MASARAFNLNLGVPGETATVQLGRPILRPNLKAVGGQLYPRFTGAFIEDPTPDVTFPSGVSVPILLNQAAPPPGIVSDDITYDPSAEALDLPYLAFYRIRIIAAYSTTGTTTLTLRFRTENDGVETTHRYEWPDRTGSGLISADLGIICDRIRGISVDNDGPDSVTVSARNEPGSSVQTTLQVTNLGIP